jgi:UDP-GlcNAc:undecaprenyl-phosphate GlcNAc-1-phosphate transferase
MIVAVFWPAVIALVLSLVVVPLSIRLGHRFDLLDHPGRHKRHKKPVPFVGGTVLFTVFWVTVFALRIFSSESALGEMSSIPWTFGGAVVIFAVGLIDDLRPLSAFTKLTAQAGTGVLLFMGGLTIDPLFVPFLGKMTLGPWSALITVLWVIGLTNAINLIDGLDGLAAGVSLIAALTLSLLGVIYQAPAVTAVAGSLVGFLAVFLYYNRYPARIFLGDSGSLQLGYYFAVVSLLVPFKSYTAAALYLPLLALGVPILETAVSIIRRLVSGRGIMSADRRHLFHYLALAGLSPRRVVWIFWGLSLVFGGTTLAMFLWDRVLVSIILGVFMVVIFVAFLIFTANLPRVRKDGPRAGR